MTVSASSHMKVLIGLYSRPVSCRELRHHLARETRHLADEVGAVVDRARLEIRLVLHAAGEARIVHVDQRRNALARSLLVGVDPLPAPLAMQFVGNPCERAFDQRAFAVVFDGVGGFGEEGLELDRIARRKVSLVPRDVSLQLD